MDESLQIYRATARGRANAWGFVGACRGEGEHDGQIRAEAFLVIPDEARAVRFAPLKGGHWASERLLEPSLHGLRDWMDGELMSNAYKGQFYDLNPAPPPNRITLIDEISAAAAARIIRLTRCATIRDYLTDARRIWCATKGLEP